VDQSQVRPWPQQPEVQDHGDHSRGRSRRLKASPPRNLRMPGAYRRDQTGRWRLRPKSSAASASVATAATCAYDVGAESATACDLMMATHR
jgi:hypothetical protein